MIFIKQKDHVHMNVAASDDGITREISDFFTFEVPGASFMPSFRNRHWDGKIRLYNMQTMELYVGLLPYLLEFAEQLEYKVVLEMDDIGESMPMEEVKEFTQRLKLHGNGKPIQARDYQENAIYDAINRGRSLLLSPTASGKSLIIYSLARYHHALGRKQLIVVPTTSLVEQMYGDFADYSTHNGFSVEKYCHRIYGGKEKTNQADVIISTWQSIYKYPKSWFEEFDVVYGDEAHLFKAKSLQTLMDKCVNARFRIGTTGTLDGTKTHRLVLEGVFGKVYKVTDTKTLMDKKELAELKIVCMLIEYADNERKLVSKMTYPEEMDFLVSHVGRNDIITKLTVAQKGNTLLLYQFVEKHGAVLNEMIKKMTKRPVYFVFGGTETTQREEIRKLTEQSTDTIIIASYGTFSTGINIRSLNNIVFASPSKSRIRNLQSIGRGLRKSEQKDKCNLFDVGDDLSWKDKKNYTLNQLLERVKMYNEESFDYKIVKVNSKI
jgi:superfamily II DNA or RNA helicase